MSADGKAGVERIRADLWLWCARFARTRADAQSLAASGKVRLNGERLGKPGHGLKRGDIVTVPQGREVRVVRILGFAERRGPAASARGLYEILDPGETEQ